MGSVTYYKCEKCGLTFDNVTQLNNHDRTAHPGIDQV
jgi:predicted nucleic acid-binding Zn ribbon protein